MAHSQWRSADDDIPDRLQDPRQRDPRGHHQHLRARVIPVDALQRGSEQRGFGRGGRSICQHQVVLRDVAGGFGGSGGFGLRPVLVSRVEDAAREQRRAQLISVHTYKRAKAQRAGGRSQGSRHTI
eukprot:TRINITY_DN6406_c0_g1_i2.p2 TRINITY_DN6406_c0_g1~~TRINITY_DN6406_c0_g1_i2.p2  ORF type:complete len:126 (-),score=7.75 TRINITY_DN6406_c0_g1_i2:26-403(-)